MLQRDEKGSFRGMIENNEFELCLNRTAIMLEY